VLNEKNTGILNCNIVCLRPQFLC